LVAARGRHVGESLRAAGAGLGGGSARLDLAAHNYRDGQDYEFENIATVVTPDLAYTVEIERVRTRVGGSNQLTQIAIRVTTVFRREDGAWKVTHRHGDPITSMRPPESVLQR
jgi:ketosteroid isomerase-like protein